MSLGRYANYPHAHNYMYAPAEFPESESMNHMCSYIKQEHFIRHSASKLSRLMQIVCILQ